MALNPLNSSNLEQLAVKGLMTLAECAGKYIVSNFNNPLTQSVCTFYGPLYVVQSNNKC